VCTRLAIAVKLVECLRPRPNNSIAGECAPAARRSIAPRMSTSCTCHTGRHTGSCSCSPTIMSHARPMYIHAPNHAANTNTCRRRSSPLALILRELRAQAKASVEAEEVPGLAMHAHVQTAVYRCQLQRWADHEFLCTYMRGNSLTFEFERAPAYTFAVATAWHARTSIQYCDTDSGCNAHVRDSRRENPSNESNHIRSCRGTQNPAALPPPHI